MNLVESLSVALRALPGVEQGRSRFGNAGRLAWKVNGREFAHLHADDLLDLRLPPARQKQLREDARARFRSSRSEWIEFEFHSERDVADLAGLAHEAWVAAKEHAT
jgi:hypothetical protein